MKSLFLFDLDSTITKQEILPLVSTKIGANKQMRYLTEKTMQGELPFKESFIQRVELLKEIPVDIIQDIVCNIKLNEYIVKFILENKDRCYIVTGNLDVWIEKLLIKLDMQNHCYSSKAYINNNKLHSIISVIDKNIICNQFIQPFVAIGDGNNDSEMIKKAKIGIGFGGVRNIAPAVMETATHLIYDEKVLYNFLNRIIEEEGEKNNER